MNKEIHEENKNLVEDEKETIEGEGKKNMEWRTYYEIFEWIATIGMRWIPLTILYKTWPNILKIILEIFK